MRFSDLQAGVSGDLKRTDKTVEKVLPLRGDTRTARLRVFLSGYATAVAPTTIRMTVWVNGHATTKVYAGGQDGEFVHTVPVRLNGAPECRIKVQFHVNLNGSDGYIVISAIDGSTGTRRTICVRRARGLRCRSFCRSKRWTGSSRSLTSRRRGACATAR